MKRKQRHFGLLSLLTFVVFVALIINSAISGCAVMFLVERGVLNVEESILQNGMELVAWHCVVSMPVGLMITLMVVRFPLKPVRNLIDSMDTLASGDFKIRVNAGAIMRRYPAFVDVADSFNKMAQQLESTEMLRSDFINNFSHEFKTPIVSIAGFARLLKKGNLTPQQQAEYLAIIEEESMRLSYMATNVLNLTKIENQTILTDISQFNLSEQLRSCILLLEREWEHKNLELQLNLGEYTIWGNEELLKQTWINLLDNAVKFAPQGHTVSVTVKKEAQTLLVTVSNTGSQIPREKLDKIFNKFYQADESHITKGNGVGLAIVKRIVQLHQGQVFVESGDDLTSFFVRLPINAAQDRR